MKPRILLTLAAMVAAAVAVPVVLAGDPAPATAGKTDSASAEKPTDDAQARAARRAAAAAAHRARGEQAPPPREEEEETKRKP